MSAERGHSGGAAYVVAWIALVVLTITTYLVSFAHMGTLSLVVALIIASIKASFVVVIFMHMRDTRAAPRFAAFAAFLFIALICLGVAADVAARPHPH
ncbi:MAG TPA: cytochrome C oxidase subunit IV family protein [Kofleriaceae bacterium]|nr:cytochrome C oxidase subunit IV family protein [Kofleriaceae bacterium]